MPDTIGPHFTSSPPLSRSQNPPPHEIRQDVNSQHHYSQDENSQDTVRLKSQNPPQPIVPTITIPTEEGFLRKVLGTKAPRSGKIADLDEKDKEPAKRVHACAQQELRKIDGTSAYLLKHRLKAESINDKDTVRDCDYALFDLDEKESALMKYSCSAEEKSKGKIQKMMDSKWGGFLMGPGGMLLMSVLPMLLQPLISSLSSPSNSNQQ